MRRATCAAVLLALVAGCGTPAPKPDEKPPGSDLPAVTVSGGDDSGAVKASLSLRPSAGRVGDRLSLVLEVQEPDGVRVLEVPQSFQPLALVGSPSHSKVPGKERWSWKAAAFQVGDLEVPPVRVRYLDKDGKEGTIEIGPLPVKIVSVLKQGEEDLADVRGPADVPFDRAALIPYAIALLAAVLLFLLAWWARRLIRRSVEKRALPPPPEPAHVRALKRLDALRDRFPPPPLRAKAYYVEMSEAVREYLEGRYGIDAPERTTEEIAFLFRGVRVGQRFVDRVVQWLTRCDLVKFARHTPAEAQVRADLEEAYRFVRETAIALEPEHERREAV